MNGDLVVTLLVVSGFIAIALSVQTALCYGLWYLMASVFPSLSYPTVIQAFVLQLTVVLTVNLLRSKPK